MIESWPACGLHRFAVLETYGDSAGSKIGQSFTQRNTADLARPTSARVSRFRSSTCVRLSATEKGVDLGRFRPSCGHSVAKVTTASVDWSGLSPDTNSQDPQAQRLGQIDQSWRRIACRVRPRLRRPDLAGFERRVSVVCPGRRAAQ